MITASVRFLWRITMNDAAQELAAIFMLFSDQKAPTTPADQKAPTTDADKKRKECRELAATLIRVLRDGWSPQDISAWIRWRTRTAQRPHERNKRKSIPMSEDELLMQLLDTQRVRKMAITPQENGSRIDPFRSDIYRLRKKGGSWNDIKAWLRRYQRVNISRTALIERMQKWQNESA